MKAICLTIAISATFSLAANARQLNCSLDAQFVNGPYLQTIQMDIGNVNNGHFHTAGIKYFYHVFGGYGYALASSNLPWGTAGAQYTCTVSQ